MNAITTQPLPTIGTPMPGGFFAGAFMLNGERRALIVAPKSRADICGIWHSDEIDVPGAKSHTDGMANTQAMAKAGSPIAEQALALEIDGLQDFFIPSQDQLEVLYRALKPTTEQNWCYARSGINLSALPPTYPYTPEFPVQTVLEPFMAGGEEAFELEWYWSSTQHAGNSDRAWYQCFYNGGQSSNDKSAELRVRFVRSQLI